MIKIFNLVTDIRHIIHPLKTPSLNVSKPTLKERVSGIVCLILSIPLTLGILTGFYFYWANRKVSLVDKMQTTKVDQVMKRVFGKSQVESEEEQLVSDSARSLLCGKKKQATQRLNSLASEGRLTTPIKEALLEMVIDNNQIDMLDELNNSFVNEDFTLDKFPLYKARSVEMIKKLLSLGVPVDVLNERGRSALHHSTSVEGVEVLFKNGATLINDKDNLSPLNTVTDPKVLKTIVSEIQKQNRIAEENRVEDAEQKFKTALQNSLQTYSSLGTEEAEIKNLRGNIRALLSCIGREKVAEMKNILKECIDIGDPELLNLVIDSGAPIDADSPLEQVLGHLASNIQNKRKGNLLLQTRIDNFKACVQILLTKGANLTGKERTVLGNCMYCGMHEILNDLFDKWVAKAGALDPNNLSVALSETTLTCLSLFREKRDKPELKFLEEEIDNLKKIIEILTERGAVPQERAFSNCIRLGNPELVELFLNKGALINGAPDAYDTPIEDALDQLVRTAKRKQEHPDIDDPVIDQEIDDRKKIVTLLVNRGAAMKELLFFVEEDLAGLEDIYELLQKAGAT